MEWLGRAKIDFVHAPSPRAIREKDGTQTDLLKICEATVPPCNLNPLLFNGHLQTLWTATRPRGPLLYYRRWTFEADSADFAGSFTVDFSVDPFDDPATDPALPRRTSHYSEAEFASIASDDSRPMLVILHGLSGGSHEVYLREAVAPLARDPNWELCVINSRGCARSKITSGILYNARATWDTRQTVKWLRKTFPNRPLFAIGFSLGANILTNYCGEEGSDCVFKAAIACSNPFNLEASSKLLMNSYMGKEVYLRLMGWAMKDYVNKNRKELKQHTSLDLAAIDKVTYLCEFDRATQCPLWGYPSEEAYYRDASSTDAVLNIKIPFMALSATDDPIALKQGLPVQEIQQNPNTILVTTSLGGHLCWFEYGGTRWHTRPICNFFNYFANNVDLDSVEPVDFPPRASAFRSSAYNPMQRKMDLPR
ncbi:putative esterase [Escovopsis weberi]|uniref:alcohol O-acetyltransferase n=1 Tax=Escovopsis weberi TaxID=150374 RepID=A0A0M9VUA2_ESCWE|nr:putative esterase [Escovopsis weberi]